MQNTYVKDIMVPLSEYAVVESDASVLDALFTLRKSQKNLRPEQFKHRAVLVKDKNGRILGKVGHFTFLKALEPKYNQIGDIDIMAHAGLTSDYLSKMAVSMDLFKDDIINSCRRLKSINVVDVMHPVKEHIEEDATLAEAIHKIVMWQTMSILVTRGDTVVGILRVSDLHQKIFGEIVGKCDE